MPSRLDTSRTVKLPVRFLITSFGPVPELTLKGFAVRVLNARSFQLEEAYPEAVPLRNVDTITVAEALVEIFSRVGIPKEIMSDRGSQFKSDLMSEIHRLFSVKALYTSPYHACCNGAVERLNGVLKSIIKKLCSEHPQDLDHYIPAALFAYREIPNSSLKFSPFELLYGRKVRGPLSILHDLWTNDGIDNEVKTTYQYVLDLRSRLEETAKLAASHANISSKSYKAYYDLKSRPRKLEIGDEVLVLLPTSTNKLVMHWRGPYPIIRCHENGVDYIIKMQGKDKLFHINMLKRYFRQEDNKEKQKCKNVIQICVEEFPVNGTCEPVNLEVTDNNSFNISSELSLSQSREMSVLLNRYTDVIRDKPGLTQTIRHKIKLTSTVPINKKQYPIPLNLKQEFNKEVDKMLELGHIEPSESPYCSPVVLVKKTDGTWRVCIDFRPNNSLSDFDAEPMPTTEVALSNFSHDVYFSELDLCKGYWQVPLSSDCKIYTAFATHRGLMQWKVMPFGLKTACATFIRIKYLGVLLGHNCIAPLEEKVKAINSLPLPTTKKQLRSFLGTTGYYRKFIQNYASTAAPLSDLLRKNSSNKLNWNQQQIESFKSLKQALMSNPVLCLPDMTKVFYLRTDASNTGVGAVLLQETNNCKMPIAYASRKLLDREHEKLNGRLPEATSTTPSTTHTNSSKQSCSEGRFVPLFMTTSRDGCTPSRYLDTSNAPSPVPTHTCSRYPALNVPPASASDSSNRPTSVLLPIEQLASKADEILAIQNTAQAQRSPLPCL
ncbi:uncharacterized protein LOC119571180 [Penaeus monodon]|uniref:uncharacterized protein LOC119571180 n=1 Tax=Penaeus monodon TaxID=6687 RepID=UPI0018A6F16F|nr:uncharacterized protein LOC119571180 [Penaeus monodon]